MTTLTQLKVGEGPIRIRLCDEPTVRATFKGYVATIEVEDLYSRTRHFMYIQAKSICEGLEPLRLANDGRFEGICIRIRKESAEKFSKYVIEPCQ